jgi:hypothetical protein
MTVQRAGRGVSWTVLLAFFTTLPACGGGGESTPPTTLVVPTTVPTTVVPTTAPPPPTLPAQPPERLSKDQLRELVAPVALYPDVVLASLLPATTYPDQVTDAAGWLRQQQGHVQAIPEDRNWDGSVAGLLQFPDVLNWLDQNHPWEQQMGTAMTYQQGDVLEAIQDYRKLALDAGNLKSNQYMKVSAEPDKDIKIAPAQPDTVYVPQYDTAAVTQPQQATGINPWLAFGGGAVVGALGAWALYSIFDDDDDGGHHHGGHNKKVKQYNNYYYGGGGQRPPGGAWNPRPRPGRPGRPGQIVRPTPVQPIYTSKPGKRPGGGGVRPPHARPGEPAPGAVAQPATPPPAPGAGKETKGGGGKKQGGGKKKGEKQGGGKNVQQTKTTAPAPAPQKKKPQQGGEKKKKQQKQGGGSN